MARSILIPCGRCAYENLPQHRFCGMCGFPLPTSPVSEAPVSEQKASAPKDVHDFLTPVSATETSYNRQSRTAVETSRHEPPPPSRFTQRPSLLNLADEPEQPSTVSGPSFLGLASEPDRERASYLLEDDQSSSHHGRFVGLILILFIIALGAAAWHWRDQVGPLRARLSNRSSQTSAPSTDNSGSPISTSPSEVSPTAQTGNPADKPKTGVGDMPANPPDQNSPAPSNNASAANAQNPQQPQNTSPDNQTPEANPPAPSADASKDSGSAANTSAKQDSQTPDAEQAMEQQTAKAAVPKRPTRKTADSTAASNSSDTLEAEGEKYLYGNGVAQDCNRARRNLTDAAGQASAKAQSVLGTMYATGHCAPRDLPLAYKWFAKALHADPSNDRLSQDLRVLWNQMTPDERNLALKNP